MTRRMMLLVLAIVGLMVLVVTVTPPKTPSQSGSQPAPVPRLVPDDSGDYDVSATLNRMGLGIKGQLQKSILDLWAPPLAPSTVRRKGFDKPLIETSHMLNSADFRVNV